MGRLPELDELLITIAVDNATDSRREVRLPDDQPDSYDTYEAQPFEIYVEMQLWSDAPIDHLLRSLG